MASVTIEIAGCTGCFACSFESTREYFKAYLSEREPIYSDTVTQQDRRMEQTLLNEEADREYFKAYLSEREPIYSDTVTQQDRRMEQTLLNEEADREHLRRRVFAEPFLERAAIQRKFASFLLGQNTLLLHGSTLAVDGKAYLFTADCGVGKSTHTRLWRELLGERAVVVNDDRAFLRITPQEITAFGSPWSGKHGLDTNISAPLAGICILERGAENRIQRIDIETALPTLLHQSFLPFAGEEARLTPLAEQIAARIPLWKMQCTKAPEAAEVSFHAMSSV